MHQVESPFRLLCLSREERHLLEVSLQAKVLDHTQHLESARQKRTTARSLDDIHFHTERIRRLQNLMDKVKENPGI